MARQLNMREAADVVCSARSHYITYAGAACHIPPQAVKLFESNVFGGNAGQVGSAGYNYKSALSVNRKVALYKMNGRLPQVGIGTRSTLRRIYRRMLSVLSPSEQYAVSHCSLFRMRTLSRGVLPLEESLR